MLAVGGVVAEVRSGLVSIQKKNCGTHSKRGRGSVSELGIQL